LPDVTHPLNISPYHFAGVALIFCGITLATFIRPAAD
jgi:hypothetical protein